MRIVFAGTPDFAVPALSMLLQSPHEIIAVYTQPDRPAGRGRKPRPSPVKALALEAGLPVCQPESLTDEQAIEDLRQLKPDLMVVVAYGLLLPQAVIDIPPRGCINIHGSLLPRWRGAAPIQRALLAGDAETGITIMYIEKRLDAGPMLAKASCTIAPQDTASDLHDRLAQLGADTLGSLLPAIGAGAVTAEQQDDSQATYAAKLSKDEAEIDWSQPAQAIQRQVCAFNAWPVAHTTLDGKILRIWQAAVVDGQHADSQPGMVLDSSGKTLDVATGSGVLRLVEVQMTGSRRMDAAAFLNGNQIKNRQLG